MPVINSTSFPVISQSHKILYYIVKQSTSCPICLSPHISPRILTCGHVYCLTCLVNSKEETGRCSVCRAFIVNFYKVRWEMTVDISVGCEIVMKKCRSGDVGIGDVKNRGDFPFCSVYYDYGEECHDEIDSCLIDKSCLHEDGNQTEHRFNKDSLASSFKLFSEQNTFLETNCTNNIQNEKVTSNLLAQSQSKADNKIIDIMSNKNNTKVQIKDVNKNSVIFEGDLRALTNSTILKSNDLKDIKNDKKTNRRQFSWFERSIETKIESKKAGNLNIDKSKTVNMHEEKKIIKKSTNEKTQDNKPDKFCKYEEAVNYFFDISKIPQYKNKIETCLDKDTILESQKEAVEGEKTNVTTITQELININLLKRIQCKRLEGLFFQSSDGQPYFMKKKDVLYIIKHYKTYEHIPDYVLCRIDSLKKIKYTKDDYLYHLEDGREIFVMGLCFDLRRLNKRKIKNEM